jgi:hypothetical protein
MPFSTNDISRINLILKIQKTSFSIAELGTALRRLCIIGYEKKQTSADWLDYVQTIHNLLDFLEDYEEGLVEIRKVNSSGYTALQLAMRSFLEIAKLNGDVYSLHYSFDMVCRVCARINPDDFLRIESWLQIHVSPLYQKDLGLFYEHGVNNPAQIPMVDVAVEALKFVIVLFRNIDQITVEFTDISAEILNERRNALRPIILLTSHYEPKTPTFFERYGDELIQNGYNLFCNELPRVIPPQEFMSRDFNVAFKFKNNVFYNPPNTVKKGQIAQKVMRRAQSLGMLLENMDVAPDFKIRYNLIIFADGKFGLLRIISQYRERAMVDAVEALSYKHGTNPILLNGLDHYKGLDFCCKSRGIFPRFIILTSDVAQLIADTESGVKVSAAELLKRDNVVLVDLSKPKVPLENLLSVTPKIKGPGF